MLKYQSSRCSEFIWYYWNTSYIHDYNNLLTVACVRELKLNDLTENNYYYWNKFYFEK